MSPSSFFIALLALHFIVRQITMSRAAAFSRRRGAPTYLAGNDTIAALWVGYVVLLTYLAFDIPNRHLATWDVVGYSVVAAATLLRSWGLQALRGFYCPTTVVFRHHKVIRKGPFRWLRHPLYVGLCIELIGLGITARSGGTSVLVIVLVLELLRQNLREQELLRVHLGADYRRFALATWDVTDFRIVRAISRSWERVRGFVVIQTRPIPAHFNIARRLHP